MLKAIVAVANNNGIGLNNHLPWPKIPEDFDYFKNQTINQIIFMGSSTWLSLPKRPLPKRTNIVFSGKSKENFIEADEVICPCDTNVINNLKEMCQSTGKNVFIIGGKQTWEAFKNDIQEWHVTRVLQDFQSDTFLDIDNMLTNKKLITSNKIKSISNIDIQIEVWR